MQLKKLFYLVIFFFIIILCLFVLVFKFKYKEYFAIAKEYSINSIKSSSDDSLNIYIVGDSWAYYHKSYDDHLAQMIQMRVRKTVSVKSYGICGLTSKGVYNNLFDIASKEYAFTKIPDYCIVFAGINDTDRKVGRLFYKNHIKLIVDYLLKLKVTPVVFEIPHFDIVSSFMSRDYRTQLFYLASMLTTLSRLDCINDYRKQFEETYEEEGWNGKVLYVHSDSWNPNGYKDGRNLYTDDLMHLNDCGYNILDSFIVNTLFPSPYEE